MDWDDEASLRGWPTAETSYNETLDLLYYRCQTARQAQGFFLEQSTPNFETARETVEVAGGQPHYTQDSIWRWSEARVAASWDSFWSEEGFYYCPSPEKVRSLESLSMSDGLAAFNLVCGKIGGETLSVCKPNDEEYSILSLKPSSSSLRSFTSTESSPWSSSNLAMSTFPNSRVIDPEDPDEGEDLDLPESERPGLRPRDFGFLPPDHIPPRSPVPLTRAEPITVTLGNWEHQVTVIKPNADYRDVPSPIMLPGSPPQHSYKPSLGGFCKLAPRRESAGRFTVTGEAPGSGSLPMPNNEQIFPPPPSPALKIPERAVNFMNHPSNSDVSVLNLGSPTEPIASAHDINPSAHQPQHQSSRNSPSSEMQPSTLLQRRQDLHHDEGIRTPTILSVEVPEGNDVSWSAPVSPQKVSSPGVVFKLDEELIDT